MSYDDWRDSYSPYVMYNEALGRAAWNAAIDACTSTLQKHLDKMTDPRTASEFKYPDENSIKMLHKLKSD